MKDIRDVEKLDGVRVLVRLDLNVPVQNNVVVDDYRIRKSIPLIEYLQKRGAKIILISHIETKDNPTLEPISKYLNKLDLSWANGPSIDSNMKVYYLRFRNGDTDTLYINYVYDQSMNNNCNCVYPLRAFLYNSQVPKYDSILKVYVINK